MKKILFVASLLLIGMGSISAQKSLTAAFASQKFALVDMEYILKKIPAYEMANEQLDVISKKWQKEVDAKMQEVQTLYKNYQTELVFLSDEMKKKRENEIVTKEKEAQELKRKYFGPEGELFNKRQSLIKPIQDDIYNAIKDISEGAGFQLVMDRASSANIIFASPKIDISDEVLGKLGF